MSGLDKGIARISAFHSDTVPVQVSVPYGSVPSVQYGTVPSQISLALPGSLRVRAICLSIFC